jgi:8-oxo-dGTP diphosphatase
MMKKRSVAGVIFANDHRQVLLVKRRDVNIWALPGGGVDPGESPEEAIIREVLEETGLTVQIRRQVALYSPINRLSNHSYLYECAVVKGALALTDETQGIGFFDLNQLPQPLFFLHREWIEDALLQTPDIIQKPLTQITYFNLIKYIFCHPIQVLRLLLSRCGIPFNTSLKDKG